MTAYLVKNTAHFVANGLIAGKPAPWFARVLVSEVRVNFAVGAQSLYPVRETAIIDFPVVAQVGSVLTMTSSSVFGAQHFIFGAPSPFPGPQFHTVDPGSTAAESASNLYLAMQSVANLASGGGVQTDISPPNLVITNPALGRVVITNRVVGGIVFDNHVDFSAPIGNFVITPFPNWIHGSPPPSPVELHLEDLPVGGFPVNPFGEALLFIPATVVLSFAGQAGTIFVSEVDLVESASPVESEPVPASATDLAAATASIVAAVNAAAENGVTATNAAAAGVEGVVNANGASDRTTINAAAAAIVAAIAASAQHGNH